MQKASALRDVTVHDDVAAYLPKDSDSVYLEPVNLRFTMSFKP
jgi:hypothetical protein